jgi:CoA:oxalate CoA-transferase
MNEMWTSPKASLLGGVKVVELANYISAPMAALVLADLGAEVVKVEANEGDAMRGLGRHPSGVNPMWVNSNRGKNGLRLDLRQEADRSRMLDLLRSADVFVTNLRPSALERLGIDDAAISADNTRLIRLYVTGYGNDGPYSGYPVFDTIMQAECGLTDALADSNGPRLDRYFTIDKSVAMIGAQSVLAALYARQMSGRAERIDLAMFDAAAYFMFPDVMRNRTLASDAALSARNEHAAAIRPMEALDGWIVVLPVAKSQVLEALSIVGAADRADFVLSAPNGDEITQRLFESLAPGIKAAQVEQWIEKFSEAGIPCAPCRDLDAVLEHPQALANDLYRTVETSGVEGLGPIRMVRYPAVFDGRIAGPDSDPEGTVRLPK